MRSTLAFVIPTLVVLCAPLAAPAELFKRSEDDPLMVLTPFHPLRIEDAHPVVPGLQAGLSVGTGDREVTDGAVLRPEALLGLAGGLQLGVALNFSLSGASQTAGPIEAHAMGQLVREEGLVPALAIRASLFTPGFDAGAGGELVALATRRLGAQRVHVNVGFRAQGDTPNRYRLGAALDRRFGERLLLVADVYYDRPLGERDGVLGVAAGANTRLTERLLLQAGAGITTAGGDVDPRLLLGLRQLF